MTTTTTEEFLQFVAADKKTQAKWNAIADVIKDRAAEHGAEIYQETVANMGVARLALWADEPLSGERFDRELYSLPEVRAAKRAAATRAELEAGNQDTIARVNDMSKADRMEYARKNDLMGESETPKTMSADEEADRLRLLLELPPAARINAARKWGML